MDGYRGDQRGGDEVEDEEGEDLTKVHLLARFLAALPGLEESQDQGDGDDGQGPGEFYRDGLV